MTALCVTPGLTVAAMIVLAGLILLAWVLTLGDEDVPGGCGAAAHKDRPDGEAERSCTDLP